MSTPIQSVEGSAREIAAVDLGSNSFHLLVARTDGREIQVIDRLREPVRLAAGVGPDRRLQPDVAQRALACLQRFGQRLRGIPPECVRAVGTNTMRKLRRSSDFHVQAEAALGHPIEVISGLEEARLVYGGVTHGMGRARPRRLVVDIGGGSTELIIGRHETPRLMESVSLGCVVHTQRFFEDGVITAARFKRARLAARVELEFLERRYRRAGWDVAIGSSGTIRGIWRVILANGWSDQHITREALEKVVDLVLTREHIDQIDFAGLREDRRPVFVGGLAVLAGIFDSLALKTLETSDRALREGLVYDLLGRLSNHDVRDEAVQAMARRYGVDQRHAAELSRTALRILDQVGKTWGLDTRNARQLLDWAARLHEVGLAITHNGYHKHSQYILQHSDLQGFSQTDQKLLAALVRLHRGRFALEVLDEVPTAWVEPLKRMAMVLRLAYLLHRSRTPDLKPPVRVNPNRRGYELSFTQKRWLERHPLTQADLEREVEYLAAAQLRLKLAT
ncbi:exopolyphosphatase / guanosine-5'-triphosphate,3'-diphosphate pyrophosphatase [Fontimonas thermophila]|uniref:Exopolyphosphatase / guanosine-5'-triphosphate,3'-diphosphate pyrophosphatase n=1 Tax=Fontimonas thermophila TaxID=1076937 RepID=A0A1I2GYH1_9GAMM|nr:Ppx/GppA phosphatase family protein [Fontimonas thermophila]SFF22472.1 exopolyphosphatase / guanosine-5'-triphosphate,3'-diphosphate pyrophosphatase [Fontimonas thermophila]